MRLSSSIRIAVFALLVTGMVGCQSGGQGGGGGWRGLSWNPAHWGRPGAGALARSEAPTKPSDESLPSLAVSQGTEVPSDNSTAPPSQYASTTAGYDAASGYPAPSGGYPNASMSTASSANNASMAPQQGSYGAYGGGEAATASTASTAGSYPANGYPSTQVPSAGVANPYRTPVETAAASAPTYPPYGSSPASSPAASASADAQYAASLQSAANQNIATQYANDPNSRYYGGEPTSAVSAVPNAPYAGNYSAAAPSQGAGANAYSQGGSYAPPAPQYTASTQSSPTAGVAGASTGAYGGTAPYGTSANSATSAPFRPGSCTAYPTTTASSLSSPAAATASPYGSYPSYPSQGTAPSTPAASNCAPAGYQAPAYQPPSYY